MQIQKFEKFFLGWTKWALTFFAVGNSEVLNSGWLVGLHCPNVQNSCYRGLRMF